MSHVNCWLQQHHHAPTVQNDLLYWCVATQHDPQQPVHEVFYCYFLKDQKARELLDEFMNNASVA